MLGIIAWIRPDGRKALVIVAGSDQMASGDPGSQSDESLKVGDLVHMPCVNEDQSEFRTGLTLVRSGFWPQIVRDIGAIAKGETASQTVQPSNVIDLGAVRSKKNISTEMHGNCALAAE